MPAIHELITHIEQLAPLTYQESYDNAGLIVGDANTDITGVLVSLDATEAVVDEAIAKGCNVVVSHHPIVFRGLKKLSGNTYVERTVIKAIKHEVALYASHTNLDNVTGGVNFRMAQQLGLIGVQILAPRTTDQTVGAGAIGMLSTALDESAFLAHLTTSMNLRVIRHTPLLNRPIQRVAVCGGAGSFLQPDAQRAGADAFVTADYKYHEFFDADGRMLLCDIGHYESEAFTKELLSEYISQKFTTFAVVLSETITNPVQYYV